MPVIPQFLHEGRDDFSEHPNGMASRCIDWKDSGLVVRDFFARDFFARPILPTSTHGSNKTPGSRKQVSETVQFLAVVSRCGQHEGGT